MLGTALTIGFLGLSAWGCAAIIAEHYGVMLPMFHPVIAHATWLAGPGLLLLVALLAWRKARQWRRMDAMRETPAHGLGGQLARGANRVDMPADSPGGLEWLTGKLVLLALITIPFWIDVARPELWAVAIFAVASWIVR